MSIIKVAWNRLKILWECLWSLKRKLRRVFWYLINHCHQNSEKKGWEKEFLTKFLFSLIRIPLIKIGVTQKFSVFIFISSVFTSRAYYFHFLLWNFQILSQHRQGTFEVWNYSTIRRRKTFFVILQSSRRKANEDRN